MPGYELVHIYILLPYTIRESNLAGFISAFLRGWGGGGGGGGERAALKELRVCSHKLWDGDMGYS